MRTVATFSKPEEAHLFRTRLEAAGIAAYVQDEHMVQVDWLMSNAIGGVRVQVAEEDVDATRELLGTATAPQASEFPCPVCGSEHTSVDELPRRVGLLSLLALVPGLVLASLTLLSAGTPLLFSRRRWRCQDCNHVWKPGA